MGEDEGTRDGTAETARCGIGWKGRGGLCQWLRMGDSGCQGGEGDENVRESSPQPGRRLKGVTVTRRRVTGHKDTGRNETGRKETGCKEICRKAMRGKVTGGKGKGTKETGAEETRGGHGSEGTRSAI